MPTTESKQLITIKAAAAHASVQPGTIRRWIAGGLLPGYRLGPRALRVDLADLNALARPLANGR